MIRTGLAFGATVLLSLTLVGCATRGENIKDVMLPLAVVRKVVMDNVPGGLQKQSLNGREITGEFFNASNLDEPTDTSPERARAKITILGSRRPYTINVSVVREKKIKISSKGPKNGPKNGLSGKYQSLGEDSKLAKQVVKRLKEALANRPADINVIDEFRAF